MFQYALYLRLKQLGRIVKIDDVNGFIGDPNNRRPALGEVFGINYEKASKKEIRDILDSHKDPISIAKRKLYGRKSKRYREKDGNFDEYVLEGDDMYLDGYWQTEKYFDSPQVLSRLKEEFVLSEAKLVTNYATLSLLREITDSNSVSVHVRRGDYLNPDAARTHGNICTEEYYSRAIDMARKEMPDCKFFFFSNDEEWLHKNVNGCDKVAVKVYEDKPDITEMLLMSSCHHHIMANSSYSWWACWMNDDDSKKIYAPPKWVNTKKMDDIYTDKMIRIW